MTASFALNSAIQNVWGPKSHLYVDIDIKEALVIST